MMKHWEERTYFLTLALRNNDIERVHNDWLALQPKERQLYVQSLAPSDYLLLDRRYPRWKETIHYERKHYPKWYKIHVRKKSKALTTPKK